MVSKRRPDAGKSTSHKYNLGQGEIDWPSGSGRSDTSSSRQDTPLDDSDLENNDPEDSDANDSDPDDKSFDDSDLDENDINPDTVLPSVESIESSASISSRSRNKRKSGDSRSPTLQTPSSLDETPNSLTRGIAGVGLASPGSTRTGHFTSNNTQTYAQDRSIDRRSNGDRSETMESTLGFTTTSPPGQGFLHPNDLSPGRARVSRRSLTPRRRSGSAVHIPIHDVTDEVPPRGPFHNDDFQQALGGSKNLMRDLTRVLGSSTLHLEPEENFRAYYEKARDLSQFRCPASHVVGLIGTSGVGKSSLINSLLDLEEFARTSEGGVACTCVITEFSYHDSPDFGVKVDFFSTQELQQQFSDLLRSFRAYHLDEEPSMTREDRRDLEEKAKVAKCTFEAVFRGYRPANTDFLLVGAEEGHVQQLVGWSRLTCPLLDDDSDSTQSRVLRNAKACSKYLMKLTSEQQSGDEHAQWPFIKKINVTLKAHVLSHGLVLVDLPGLRDTNAARVKITENHVVNCDEVFAICHIDRACTNVDVENVFTLAERARLSRVGIICTKSEDIPVNKARLDLAEDKHKDTRVLRKYQKKIKSLEDDIDELNADILEWEEIEDLDSDNFTKEMRQQRRIARSDLLHKQELWEETCFNREKYLITTRNATVVAGLDSKYRARLPNNDLKIFCVSNRMYWTHRLKPKDKFHPYLELSQIRSLRQYCISLVANVQLRAALNFIENEIPSLLNSLQIWLQSGTRTSSAAERQRVADTLSSVEAVLKENLVRPRAQINYTVRTSGNRYEEHINSVMRRNRAEWSDCAYEASNEWRGWHWASYAAFCRNYGDYSTAAAGTHCWNDEAMQAMFRDMEEPWTELCQALRELQTRRITLVQSAFRRAAERLAPIDGHRNLLGDTIRESLTHREALMLYELERKGDEFESSMESLKRSMCTGIRTSLVGGLMEASYRACNMECGTGSDRRRKAIISNRFREPDLLNDLRCQAQDKFAAIVDVLQSGIKEILGRHIALLVNDLNTIRNEDGAVVEESDPAFRARVEQEMGRVDAAAAQIRAGIRLQRHLAT